MLADTDTFGTAPIERALLMPHDAAFESARTSRIWHARHPARYPAAILVAQTEADVVAGVRLAAAKGWKVAVRSGGHSFPVWSLRDDCLLIDLGQLREMTLDGETGIATATPAIQGGHDLNAFLQGYGRFFAAGACPSVGLGGFLVQGGIGWNFRGWGYAAEQVVAIDVVAANGELLRASETENADLFWAMRGAGPGFFGVITRFHVRTRPIPSGLAATTQVYPVSAFEALLKWLGQTQHSISPDVHLVLTTLVPDFPIPGHEGELVAVVWGLAFSETWEAAAAALEPLNSGPLVSQAYFTMPDQPTTLDAQYAFVDAGHPANLRYRVDSAWLEGDWDAIASASRMLVLDRPRNERGHTFFQFALPRHAPDMAMSLKTDVMVGAYIIYADEKDDEAYRAWSLAAMGALEPFTVGQYWGDSDTQHRRVKCLTDPAWERLKQIRDRRDPDQLFAGYLAGDEGYDNTNGWSGAV
ncbi:FAD-binding oxidoreductase [Novosphingobium sp.]|uniref:FAD-binding oxidoreductase n=1 Tax=Novosphingobium sp. TaxID=1874826 RepID=UPI003BACBD60